MQYTVYIVMHVALLWLDIWKSWNRAIHFLMQFVDKDANSFLKCNNTVYLIFLFLAGFNERHFPEALDHHQFDMNEVDKSSSQGSNMSATTAG